MAGISLFQRHGAEHHGSRPPPADDRHAERSAVSSSRRKRRNALRHAAVEPRRGLRHGAGRRDLLIVGRDWTRRVSRHSCTCCMSNSALTWPSWTRPSSISTKTKARTPSSRCIQAAEPRRQELVRRLNLAPKGTAKLVEMRERLLAMKDRYRRVPRRRCRLLTSVRLLVQSRLSDAAPHRLVDAGGHPGKDHQIRGRARDRRLGGTAPSAGACRPQVLCLLPPATGRRSADVRRGCAHHGPSLARSQMCSTRAGRRSRRTRRRRRSSIRSPTARMACAAFRSAIF